MRRVIVNDDMVKKSILKEVRLLDELPDDILKVIQRNKTSLGDNPAFPNVFGDNFIEQLTNKRFQKLRDDLKGLNKIDVDSKSLEGALNELILKCQKIEEPNRNRLEKICLNYIIELFEIPEDSMDIELSLVDEIDYSNDEINVDSIKTDGDDFVYNDFNEVDSLSKEVMKRRLIDSLCVGASMRLSSDIKSYISDIYDVNPDLAQLYRQILIINSYLLFTRNDVGINDDDKQQIGIEHLTLFTPDNKPKLTVQAKIFPVLLAEAIKGILELFSSHGLPQDKRMAEKVIQRADFLKAEPWDMRIGPELWTLLSNYLKDVTPQLFPYVFRRIVMLKPDNFNTLMKEAFTKTKKAKDIIDKIVKRAQEQAVNDKFNLKMTKVNDENGIITDEYIQENEL